MASEQHLAVLATILWWLGAQSHVTVRPSAQHVPDEQRLYQDLMAGYESSVRPVLNASRVITINFRLTLNQIVDLDERKQVLTTNVFIDQEWVDENLRWEGHRYNGIRTLRIPASNVWLPDTFIFNNADDGSTGFMQGVYVLLNANGSVLWPVPVKLKSSCKVDITYFPFDDQECILRFGSWIYSGEWMDFESSLKSVDLTYYIDNSEWQLVSIRFEKSVRTYACCPEQHPDLTYTLHIRRRTFYYIFNIIVPCVMLSVLTLLTFWLPTTSGEKISLGLSVFLAFSMFMLLIAEEVPATSESVPLIGIYLTTVMTMTSGSVIMAVMVINLYNRGAKVYRAPWWLKRIVLDWVCKLMRMTHDIERLAGTIRLDDEEEERYRCYKHPWWKSPELPRKNRFSGQRGSQIRHRGRTSPPVGMAPGDCELNDLHRRFSRYEARRRNNKDTTEDPSKFTAGVDNMAVDKEEKEERAEEEGEEEPVWVKRDLTSNMPVTFSNRNSSDRKNGGVDHSFASTSGHKPKRSVFDPRRSSKSYHNNNGGSSSARLLAASSDDELENDDVITCHVDSKPKPFRACEPKGQQTNCDSRARDAAVWERKQEGVERLVVQMCQKERALTARRETIVEWQTIATVIDRLLFWIFLLATVIAYIVILFAIPYSKPAPSEHSVPIRAVNTLKS